MTFSVAAVVYEIRQQAIILLGKVCDGCTSLRGSPSELWKAYFLKFLDSYAYFSLSVIFTLFLTEDFGYTDIQAGTIYGIWGALITVYGLATGMMVDNLGVAMSLRLGFAVSMISRCWIFLTTSRTVLLFNMCFLLPFGNCLGIPVLTTSIRRYTHSANRGFAYGLFYVIMNVGALLSGPVVDLCHYIAHQDDEENANDNNDDDNNNDNLNDTEYVPQEWSMTGYRLVLLTTVIANVIAVLVTCTVREIKLQSSPPPLETKVTPPDGDELSSEQDVRSVRTVRSEHNPLEKDTISVNKDAAAIATFTPLKGGAWSILKETFQTKSFWRFLAVCMITLNVRMIFRHLDSTLPKYTLREFGDNFPYGTVYSINPLLIMILVPLVTAATSHLDPLVMIHWGSYISAISPFFLVISTSPTACILFVIVLSIGEAVWSPRLYDYTMSVCQEGREGTYMALSSAPLFLAKLPVGFMSGYLLQKYCPAEGPRQSKLMWLIIGATTASSPVLMTVFWRYISYKDKVIGGDAHGVESLDAEVRYTELSEQAPSIPLVGETAGQDPLLEPRRRQID